MLLWQRISHTPGFRLLVNPECPSEKEGVQGPGVICYRTQDEFSVLGKPWQRVWAQLWSRVPVSDWGFASEAERCSEPNFSLCKNIRDLLRAGKHPTGTWFL